MRSFILLVVLAGCGGKGGNATDSGPPDTDTMHDGGTDADAGAQLTCASYCASMQSNCTGGNAQYPGAGATAVMQSCLIACSSFPVGEATDVSGNTLGCRIHFAMAAPSESNAQGTASDCTAAGPLGDQIQSGTTALCSGGDICASFCALETRACGTLGMPLPGDPKDNTNNSLYQYQDVSDCVASCHNFNKLNHYDLSSKGNSLACRLVQSINASIDVDPNAIDDCGDTGVPAHGLCAGTASP